MAIFIAPWLALRHWPANSQLRARRNAMVASTAIAQRRAEQRDVDEFMSRLTLDRRLNGAVGSRTVGVI